MTVLDSYLMIIGSIIAMIALLWLMGKAFGEELQRRKDEEREMQREDKRFGNAVDELAVRIQLDREQLFRDYLKSEEDTKWKY